MDDDSNGWKSPMLRWKYFGPILYVSKTFSEFKMKCELIGYGGYASGWDEENDIKCYESFIFCRGMWLARQRHNEQKSRHVSR